MPGLASNPCEALGRTRSTPRGGGRRAGTAATRAGCRGRSGSRAARSPTSTGASCLQRALRGMTKPGCERRSFPGCGRRLKGSDRTDGLPTGSSKSLAAAAGCIWSYWVRTSVGRLRTLRSGSAPDPARIPSRRSSRPRSAQARHALPCARRAARGQRPARRLSSSNQFTVTLSCIQGFVPSSPRTMRKAWPSDVTSKFGTCPT